MNRGVIGLQFGDEGKGKVTSILARKYDSSVVRYSGGQQAGHRVVSKESETEHIFASFGSGTLSGRPTIWSKYCTINPYAMINEMEILINKGFKPKIIISPLCPVTTPYEIEYNRFQHKKDKHGSVGLGIGATYEREDNFYSLKVEDLFFQSVLKEKLKNIRNYYLYKNQSYEFESQISALHFDYDNFITYVNSGLIEIKDVDLNSGDYIFEGSQGLLLDQNFGFFPNVTRSNVGTKNILELSNSDIEFYAVTRAYQTRHGNGFMTNEDIRHNIKPTNEKNVFSEYQGDFRISILDVDLLKYAITKDHALYDNIYNGNGKVVITCLDHVENDWRFTIHNNIVTCKYKNEFLSLIRELLKLKKIYYTESEYLEEELKSI